MSDSTMASSVRSSFRRLACRVALRGVHAWLAVRWLTVFSTTGLLSSVYYVFCSKRFRNEQRAALKGKLQYIREAKLVRASVYLLRRNVHRIEKGLIVRPRKEIYAVDYIEETVACLGHLLETAHPAELDSETAQWCVDVLARYFAVVRLEGSVLRAWTAFAPIAATRAPTGQRLPRPRGNGFEALPALEDLRRLAEHRKSVRWFQSRPVPRQLIDSAVQVAALSPSACNRQPFRFCVADRREIVDQIMRLPGGTSGFADGVPGVVVVVGTLKAFFDEVDRHLMYVDAGLASMTLSLALESLGVSSCFLNWNDFSDAEKRLGQILGLAEYERPILLLAFGFADPDREVAHSQRKPVAELRQYV